MAETKKAASSSANLKGQSSLLDLDIGKDFLTSWKSMSVDEDIDFDFGSVTKGKKKAFSFDKMDMDFNLDGDFDKMSSFKVDISDLDISSDTKKQENPRKRSKEVSAGETRKEKKADRFEFPFDFNELDSISFDSTLTKEDKKSKKNQDKEESSNRSESEGSGIQLSDEVGASEEGITQKLPASRSLTISKNDIQLGRFGEIDSMNEDAPSNSVANENCLSKSAKIIDRIAIQGTRTSPERTSFTTTEETNQESSRPVNTTSPESHAQETMVTTQETGSNSQEEVSTVPSELNTISGGGQNVNVKSVTGLGSNCENAPLEILLRQNTSSSQSLNSEMNEYVSDDHALVSDKDGTEPAQGDLQLEHTSVTTVSRELLHDTQPNGENQDLYAKLLSASLNCGTAVNKSVPDNDKETGVIRSKFFKGVGETEAHLQKVPLSHKKLGSFGSIRIGSVPLSHADESRTLDANNAQSGSKLAGILGSHSRDLIRGEPVEIGSQESVKSLSSTWEDVSTDGKESGGESLATSRIYEQDAKKGENVLEGSEKNTRSLTTFSSHVNPSNLNERKNKSTSQDFVNPRLSVSSMKSLQSAKKICVERTKTSPPNPGTRTPDLSRLRISRDRGSNPDLLKSRFQKDTNSSRNSEQIMESQGNRESKIAYSAITQKQTSPAPILKRKTFEKSNADMLTLNPAKRLSESHKENRNIRELSGRLVDKPVFNHENLAEDNTSNVISDNEIPTLGIPREVKMTELEAPLATETESNAEKAEVCSKELEDICNMLKKKHEEAKELLVRAIVNNNNLLMLNHPIYEEKISMVQKFAALLMSE